MVSLFLACAKNIDSIRSGQSDLIGTPLRQVKPVLGDFLALPSLTRRLKQSLTTYCRCEQTVCLLAAVA